MDPQLKSVLTSIGLALSSSVAAWAASKGLISAGDQSSLANGLVTVGGVAVAAALAWYKTHQVSQTSMIKAVNETKNGVTVVTASAAAAAGIPTVSEPVK